LDCLVLGPTLTSQLAMSTDNTCVTLWCDIDQSQCNTCHYLLIKIATKNIYEKDRRKPLVTLWLTNVTWHDQRHMTLAPHFHTSAIPMSRYVNRYLTCWISSLNYLQCVGKLPLLWVFFNQMCFMHNCKDESI